MGDVISFQTKKPAHPNTPDTSIFFGLPKPDRFYSHPGETFACEFSNGIEFLTFDWHRGGLLRVHRTIMGAWIPPYEVSANEKTFVAITKDFFGMAA